MDLDQYPSNTSDAPQAIREIPNKPSIAPIEPVRHLKFEGDTKHFF